MKDGYTVEADRLQSELAEHQQEYARLSSAYSKDNKRITAFLKFKSQKILTRDMLTELVERIIIHSSDSIEIVWRYEDEYRAVCGLVGLANKAICNSANLVSDDRQAIRTSDLPNNAALAKAGEQ